MDCKLVLKRKRVLSRESISTERERALTERALNRERLKARFKTER